MRLAIYGNGTVQDGTGRLLSSLASELGELGIDVTFRLRGAPRGVLPKIKWMLSGIARDAGHLRGADVIIVHTALSLNIPLLLLAQLMKRPVVGFAWDVYPESTRAAGKLTNPAVLALYGIAERLGYLLCDVLLVPSDDYIPHLPGRAAKKSLAFPMWVTDFPRALNALPPAGTYTKLAFAGQINSIRGIGGAVGELLSAYPEHEFHLSVYSADPLPDDLVELERQSERLVVRHGGYLSPDDLRKELASQDFGLVALDPAFALPAFPSKIMTYIAVGIPVLYSGPSFPGIIQFFQQSRLGARVVQGKVPDLEALRLDYPHARQKYLSQRTGQFEELVRLLDQLNR